MKKLGFAVVVLLALAPTAYADRQPLKLSHLNLGHVGVGETASGTITVTNRSKEPVRVFSQSLSALSNVSIELVRDPNSCRDLIRTGGSLEPGSSCSSEIRLRLLDEGRHRARFCVNEFDCRIVRARAP